MSESFNTEKGAQSVPLSPKKDSAAAGRKDRFASVKIDLAIIIFAAISMFFLVEVVLPNSIWGMLVLLVTGVLGALWIVRKTRKITKQYSQEQSQMKE